jgi:hypothetical protein
MIVFLDTEFTDLVDPKLLSLGLITIDGREHYVELDLMTDVGRARRSASSDFVRYGGVLEMWGAIYGADSTELEMGRRTGEWLLELAAEAGTRVEVAFDYDVDYKLMECAIRGAGLWDQVHEAVLPLNVGALTGSPEGEIAAEKCFREISRRGIRRHHALADAIALRAAYVAANGTALQMLPRQFPEAKKPVPVEKLGFPTADWVKVVNELIDGVLKAVAADGEVNQTDICLIDLRRLAERARGTPKSGGS